MSLTVQPKTIISAPALRSDRQSVNDAPFHVRPGQRDVDCLYATPVFGFA
jgi:hypothetical protein